MFFSEKCFRKMLILTEKKRAASFKTKQRNKYTPNISIAHQKKKKYTKLNDYRSKLVVVFVLSYMSKKN